MTDETNKGGGGGPKSARRKVGDGIRQGIGVLSAFKDALEETIQEARERGDLSTERAKEVMKSALGKAQAAASEAREKFDFATQGDLDSVRAALEALNQRIASLEATVLDRAEDEGEAESEP
jgi:polyhydroxyalkanoate synthesis regulator phasin